MDFKEFCLLWNDVPCHAAQDLEVFLVRVGTRGDRAANPTWNAICRLVFWMWKMQGACTDFDKYPSMYI